MTWEKYCWLNSAGLAACSPTTGRRIRKMGLVIPPRAVVVRSSVGAPFTSIPLYAGSTVPLQVGLFSVPLKLP